MKKSILALLSVLLLSGTAQAIDGTILVHAKVTAGNAAGTARTIILENAEYVSSTLELNTPEVRKALAQPFEVLFNTQTGAQAYECNHAIVIFSAGEGNFLPLADGDENYFIPELLGFFCMR